MESRLELYCETRHWVKPEYGVAVTPLQAMPAWNCWSGVEAAEVDAGLAVDGDGGTGAEGVGADDVIARGRAGDEAAVVAPVEGEPRRELARDLVLQVGGLVVLLVVVDAEGIAALADGCSGAGDLRREEARGHRGHDDEGGEAVEVGHVARGGRSRGSWSCASRWGR